ncbi:MAG: FAD-binding oxidoreductase [Thermoprotei archaeon]
MNGLREVLSDSFVKQLEGVFGSRNVSTEHATRKAHSADYSWFSPLLRQHVNDALADIVVWADKPDQLGQLLELASEKRIPIVARGGGTGNYAQSVPLMGGIVVDITRMRKILSIEDGCAIVEPGARLGELKAAAEDRDMTLRVYPSTYLVSTAAGFVEGGSGGVGSVEYGRLWDGNVDHVKLVGPSLKETLIHGKGLDGVIHSAGTTGLLTEVGLRLAPKRELAGVLVGFKTLKSSINFALRLANTQNTHKRLLSLYEPAVTRYFEGSVRDRVLRGKTGFFQGFEESYVVMAIVDASAQDEVSRTLASSDRLGVEWLGGNEAEMLSDYTFNHTTLWATKQERATWQHVFFEQQSVVEHSHAIKEKYGNRILMHYEFIKSGEDILPAGLPIVFFEEPQELIGMLEYMRKLGVRVENIHSYNLEDRLDTEKIEAIRRLKALSDPDNILNPGKLRYY